MRMRTMGAVMRDAAGASLARQEMIDDVLRTQRPSVYKEITVNMCCVIGIDAHIPILRRLTIFIHSCIHYGLIHSVIHCRKKHMHSKRVDKNVDS